MWAGPRLRFPLDLASLAQLIDFEGEHSFSLEDGARLVAFGQLVPKAARRGHIARVIVAPDARRHGHGQALLHGLIDMAMRRGLYCVSLNVDHANAAAIALYEKLGFSDAHRPHDEPDSYGSRYLERML